MSETKTKKQSSYNGIERRNSDERRTHKKDIRKNKTERRLSKKERRRQDLINNSTYFITMIILLFCLVSWTSYSVFLYIEGIK